MKTLERRLGLPSVVAISISAMLGSGIFVLPAIAFLSTGPSLFLAYLAAGLCVLPTAISKSELASAMPTSGGSYVYLDRAFGPLVGTIAGLGLWLSLLLKSAFALKGMGAYLSALATVPVTGTALILLGLIVWLNIRGVRKVSNVQIVIVVVSIVGMLALVIGGLHNVDLSRMTPLFTKGGLGFASTAALLFVSYAGVTKIAAVAEEVRDPDRNVPRGMYISLIGIALLYTAVAFMMVALTPPEVMGDKTNPRPVYTLATEVSALPVVATLAAVLGVVTMSSMGNAGLLAASRFPFAMARDNLAPRLLAYLDPKYITPTAAIVASGILMALAITTLDIVRIAKLASTFQIMMFMLANLAVIVFRESGAQWYRPGYRAPLYPIAQVLGVIAGLGLLVMLGPLALAAGLAIGIPGLALYVIYGRKRADRLGVLSQRGRRSELLQGESRLREASLHGEAAVVVAFIGKPSNPETMVELGHGFAKGGLFEVVHLLEVPEQTAFQDVEGDPAAALLERKVAEIAKDKNIQVAFESIVSRDVVKTIYEITARLNCRWLVIEAGGRTEGRFTLYNPMGWLRDHLECNLATLNDAGLHDIRKILVHTEPGPHDSLVAGAAEDLAELYDAELTFTRFIGEGDETASQHAQQYLDQMRKLIRRESSSLLLHGSEEAVTIGQASAGYDLLLTAGAPVGSMLGRLRPSKRDRLTEQAACSVLRLTTPRIETHEAIERSVATDVRNLELLREVLLTDCVEPGLEPAKKDVMFQRFAQKFASTIKELDAGQILHAMRERERTQNTAVGGGLAIPHATLDAAERTYLGIYTTTAPIDYGAPDDVGVDVFFVTMGSLADRHKHLILLSSIARLMVQTNLMESLRKATAAEEIIGALDASIAELRKR